MSAAPSALVATTHLIPTSRSGLFASGPSGLGNGFAIGSEVDRIISKGFHLLYLTLTAWRSHHMSELSDNREQWAEYASKYFQMGAEEKTRQWAGLTRSEQNYLIGTFNIQPPKTEKLATFVNIYIKILASFSLMPEGKVMVIINGYYSGRTLAETGLLSNTTN
jgi:hypothetical protein